MSRERMVVWYGSEPRHTKVARPWKTRRHAATGEPLSARWSRQRRLPRRQVMGPLWGRAVTTHRNRRQTQPPRKPLDYLRTVAHDCHHLRRILDGKEGVDRVSRVLYGQQLGSKTPEAAPLNHASRSGRAA